jgi:hypothetical protein
MPVFRKPAEVRREREIVRTALRRFMALLAPVTAMQLFSAANGKPMDPAHPGLPPYARRTLDRLRHKGVLTLSGKYWRVAPDRADVLRSILEHDKEVDQLHLADKYLWKSPTPSVTQEEANEIAEAMESAAGIAPLPAPEVEDPEAPSGAELEEILAEVPEPDTSQPWPLPIEKPKKKSKAKPPPDPPASEPELPEEQGEELPFPYYVAKRFDMLSEELNDLADSLPSDTKAHLEGIGVLLDLIAGDVKVMTNMFLDTASNVEQLLKLQKEAHERQQEDHDFLMSLKTSLAPKVP